MLSKLGYAFIPKTTTTEEITKNQTPNKNDISHAVSSSAFIAQQKTERQIKTTIKYNMIVTSLIFTPGVLGIPALSGKFIPRSPHPAGLCGRLSGTAPRRDGVPIFF